MTPAEQLAREIVDARLDQQPQTRHLYLTDAPFHASVEHMRMTLVVVAERLRRHELDAREVRDILAEAVAEILDDRNILTGDAVQRAAASELARRPPAPFVADWP